MTFNRFGSVFLFVRDFFKVFVEGNIAMFANRKRRLLFYAITFTAHTVRRTARYDMLSRKFSEDYGFRKIVFNFHRAPSKNKKI